MREGGLTTDVDNGAGEEDDGAEGAVGRHAQDGVESVQVEEEEEQVDDHDGHVDEQRGSAELPTPHGLLARAHFFNKYDWISVAIVPSALRRATAPRARGEGPPRLREPPPPRATAPEGQVR